MKHKRKAAVGLTLVGGVAATTLAGGLFASGVVEITNGTKIAVGASTETALCDTNLIVKTGLARFDIPAQAFLVRDITMSDIALECSGLYATVIGTDMSGNPVAEATGVIATDTLLMNLSNPITPDSVSRWHIALQGVADYAGAGVTAPIIGSNSVIAEPGEIEAPPVVTSEPDLTTEEPPSEASPTASDPTHTSSLSEPKPSASPTPTPTPTPTSFLSEPKPSASASPKPTPTPTPTSFLSEPKPSAS